MKGNLNLYHLIQKAISPLTLNCVSWIYAIKMAKLRKWVSVECSPFNWLQNIQFRYSTINFDVVHRVNVKLEIERMSN